MGVAGIDPHKHSLTIAVVDGRGARTNVPPFATTAQGFVDLLAWLEAMDIEIGRIGVEGANGLGRQLTQFLVQSGFDVREVQSNRTAERRRRRQKTDREGAEAIARETLAHDDLPPRRQEILP